jgi:hypothetical protein
LALKEVFIWALKMTEQATAILAHILESNFKVSANGFWITKANGGL